eukprot:GFUD01073242.1.p1 GENE.GFUD01073242.1~~GFUD01073242.1.p1  ORF type:complete len:117 (-),score=28.11 GFUD01073242.1:32-382(-)
MRTKLLPEKAPFKSDVVLLTKPEHEQEIGSADDKVSKFNSLLNTSEERCSSQDEHPPSSELLCQHCGFVFWVEETLSRHCKQFHEVDDNKLMEEGNNVMGNKVASRKTKRRRRGIY